MVAQAHVNGFGLPEPVGSLVTADAEFRDVDQELEAIKIVRSLLAEQLALHDREAGQIVDLASDVPGQVERPTEDLGSRGHRVTPPAVDGRVDHDVGTGGHQQVGTVGEMVGIDQIALDVEDRSLLETGAHLWTLTTQMSACAFMAQVGRSLWTGRCAPQASSTIKGLPRL